MRISIFLLVVMGVIGCGGSSEPHEAPPDMSLSTYDADGNPGPAYQEVVLVSPQPFQTNIGAGAALVFGVDLHIGLTEGKATQSDVENGISFTQRGASVPIAGTFAWAHDENDGFFATFTPASPLPSPADFVVDIHAQGNFNPDFLTHAGFTTGSHPRVQSIKLTSKDGVNLTYVALQASELVNAAEVVANTTLVDKTTGATIAATVTIDPPGATSAGLFEITPPTPNPLSHTLRLSVGTVHSPGGLLLDSTDWDSTLVGSNGVFAVDLSSSQLNTCGTNCWQWQPTVN